VIDVLVAIFTDKMLKQNVRTDLLKHQFL